VRLDQGRNGRHGCAVELAVCRRARVEPEEKRQGEKATILLKNIEDETFL
jgi:hypothetical protein